MIGYLQISEVIATLIQRNIVHAVFHSVDIFNHNGERFPGYRDGDEWMYVGVDDTKFMNAYVRELSSFKVDKTEDIGGGKKRYRGEILYRLVVFNDNETRNHDDLLIALMAFTFFPHITLKRLINNSEELLKEEARVKDFQFGASTFYKAIDFNVTLSFIDNKCNVSIGCGQWPNPIDGDNIKGAFSLDFNNGFLT